MDSGREYVKNQSAFATSLQDLKPHFAEDKTGLNALGKIIDCLQDMNKFHTTLLDQASLAVINNLSCFVKRCVRVQWHSIYHCSNYHLPSPQRLEGCEGLPEPLPEVLGELGHCVEQERAGEQEQANRRSGGGELSGRQSVLFPAHNPGLRQLPDYDAGEEEARPPLHSAQLRKGVPDLLPPGNGPLRGLRPILQESGR